MHAADEPCSRSYAWTACMRRSPDCTWLECRKSTADQGHHMAPEETRAEAKSVTGRLGALLFLVRTSWLTSGFIMMVNTMYQPLRWDLGS